MSALTKSAVPIVWQAQDLLFAAGQAAAVNLAASLANPYGYPVTYTIAGALPAGVTLAGSLVSYDGVGAPASTVATLRADCGVVASVAVRVEIAALAESASHVVYSNGQMSAGATHATIAAAIAAMTPGATLELRNATAGNTTPWAQAINFAGKVGTAANPYRLQVRDGDQVVIRTGGTLLNLTNCAYVEVRGNSTGVTGLQIGDERDYVHTAAEWQNCYPHNYGLLAANSHHWKISNATLTGGRQYYSNDTGFDCADYELNNVRVCKTGTNCYNTNNTDARNICRIRGRRVRIIGCVADHGGHEPFEFCAASLVVRGGTFSGYWADLSPWPGSRCSSSAGNRNFNMGNGPQLIEGATFRDSGDSGDQTKQVLMKNETNHLIMRGCYLLDADSAIYLSAYTTQDESSPATTPSMNHQCIYHCTAYNVKGTWYNNTNNYQAAFGAKFYEQNRVQNNLFMACADGDRSTPAGGQIFSYDSRNVLDGFANGFKGSLIKGNQLGGTSANWNVELKADGGTTGVYPITAPHANWTANISDNRVSAVTFSAEDAAPHRSPTGFSVTNWGTGAAGDAPALATVTAATGNYDPSEWIALDSARPFFDGWGIAGEVGDYVVIGATASGGLTRQITACDYANNRIRVSATTSVTSGDGVWFAGNPANGAASVWDNRGAAQ